MSAGTERSSAGAGTDDAATPAVGRRAFICGTVAAATAAGATATGGSVAAQEDPYGGWFDDVPNYEATVDYRGQEEVTVRVGTGDGLRYGPPAILVDPGTTVVWEWTGEGAPHNVVHEAGEEDGAPAFESELLSEPGATFEYTFEDAEEGIYRYFCSPHRAAGMKGAVAVGDVADELVDPAGGGDGGQPLSPSDLFVAGVGLVVGLALVLAVARPRMGSSDSA